MIKKVDLVRKYVAAGEFKRALQICKDWDYSDPTHREILRLGYECLLYPEFYSQLGKDTEYQYEEAVRVLKEVYGK